MKTRTPDQLLDEIAREGIGRDTNLSSGLLAKMRKGYEKQMKTKKLLIGSVTLVLVLVVLATIPSVTKAIGRLFGYVPGSGFVEQNSSIRVLQNPVEFKSGETTITVNQAVVDSEHTSVQYQIENIPDIDTDNARPDNYCRALPRLKLTDGTYLEPKTISGDIWASGLSRQLDYTALPAAENTVTMEFSCIEASPIIADAPKIEIQLNFVAAPVDMTVYPLVELPTPTVQTGETSLSEDQASVSSQISLTLNKYVQTVDQLILFGVLKTGSTDFRLAYLDSNAVHLFDEEGNPITIEEEFNMPDPEMDPRNAQNLPLTYRTAGRYIPGDASLVIDNLWIERNANASFSFDPGPNPQPGQTWTINQTLDIDGYSILIKDVTKAPRGEGLTFTFETPENLSNISLMDLDNSMLGGGGGENSTGFSYSSTFPNGEITITLTSYTERINGPWQTTVTLPAFTDGALPTAMSEACLTKATWDAALLNSSREIPVELGGVLILEDVLAPDYYYHILSASLSGDEPTDLGLGTGGSLSPDGQTLVYATDEGLKFLTLVTGEDLGYPRYNPSRPRTGLVS